MSAENLETCSVDFVDTLYYYIDCFSPVKTSCCIVNIVRCWADEIMLCTMFVLTHLTHEYCSINTVPTNKRPAFTGLMPFLSTNQIKACLLYTNGGNIVYYVNYTELTNSKFHKHSGTEVRFACSVLQT